MKNQLGQLLLVDVPKAAWNPALERLLSNFQPTGALFHRLTPATTDVCTKCARAVDPPPFLAIEEEGGGALGDIFDVLPPVSGLDATGAEQAGELIGRAMALLGLNLNLAPTLDLPAAVSLKQTPIETPLITTPVEITRRAEGFVRGLARHRILSCARHFPGMPQGSPAHASSQALVVDRPMATLWREDLVPYRTLGAKLDMIQVTHAVHKAYDYEFPRPASLSPAVVEGLLRVKLGYPGVAVADVAAASRAANIGTGEAAVRAVAAGCDLLLVSGEEKALKAVTDALQVAIESGVLSQERIGEALARIKKAKKGIGKPPKEPSDRELAQLRRDFAEFGKRQKAREPAVG